MADKSGEIVDIDSSQIEESGYDGIIDDTVSESLGGVPEGTVHIVVFNSNQIKLVENQKPTRHEDIRFSLKRNQAEALESLGGIDDPGAREALGALVEAGYDVIPRSVSNKITYDGVEYALTPNQVKDFEKVYFVANEALASLVKLPQFKEASDEVKAKAVNFIYNVYYNLALQDFLGIDLETKSVLFAEAIDIEKLAIVIATANSLTADLDKKGKAISGTRKAKVQKYINSLQLKAVEKYMIMGYLGYTNTKGEAQVKAYINRLSLTKTEKAKLLEYSGYAS